MQSTNPGNMDPPRPGTSFKNGPYPQPSGAANPVGVGSPGPAVVEQTGNARRTGPAAPKAGTPNNPA